MAGGQRDVVGGTDTLIVLYMKISFRPIEPQDPGAADQPIQVWTVQCHKDAEPFIVHGPLLYLDIRLLLWFNLVEMAAGVNNVNHVFSAQQHCIS
jgi:hypothetical protein